MTQSKRSLKAPVMLIVAILAFYSTKAISQVVPTQIYDGALVYAMPILRTVPAINSSQRPNIVTDYLWLDDAFKQIKPGFAMDNYIRTLSYGDTLKFLASILYQVVDDNPITFHRWAAAMPSPYVYKAQPGEIRTRVQSRFSKLAVDTNRTPFLLNADIIADIKVTDTLQYLVPSDHTTPRSVVVNSEILDGIKGKYVPGCSFIYNAHKKGASPQSNYPPVFADTVPAATGTCFQFEYCPNWVRGIQTDVTYPGQPELTDSTGDWIKKDSEYVVFLDFVGLTADTANGYYALMPAWGWFGSNDGLYPVRNGKVFDPNDDFGIGASSGLPVATWKSRVRARINKIVNP